MLPIKMCLQMIYLIYKCIKRTRHEIIYNGRYAKKPNQITHEDLRAFKQTKPNWIPYIGIT